MAGNTVTQKGKKKKLNEQKNKEEEEAAAVKSRKITIKKMEKGNRLQRRQN